MITINTTPIWRGISAVFTIAAADFTAAIQFAILDISYTFRR